MHHPFKRSRFGRRAVALGIAAALGAAGLGASAEVGAYAEPPDRVGLHRRAGDLAALGRAPGLRKLPVRSSLYNLESRPLRAIASESLRREGDGRRLSVSGDDALQFDALPAPIVSFDGVASPSTTGRIPPDPTGEAGPQHYVQQTNSGWAIYDKTGTQLFASPTIGDLWQGVGDLCDTSTQGDPIVQYDQLAERWLLTEFAFGRTSQRQPVGPFFECIAISQTSDPLGDYFLYSFFVDPSLFPDFPKFGVWPDGYYMTVHLIDFATGSFEGLGAIGFERRAMLEGKPADQIGFASTTPDFFGALPGDVDGLRPPPAGSPNLLVVPRDMPSQDVIEVFQIFLDWMDPASAFAVGPLELTPASFDANLCGRPDLPCIPQPDTTNKLSSLAGFGVGAPFFAMYRLAYRNFGTHQSVVMNHTVDANGADQAAIRWYEIRDPLANAVIHQQGTYAPDATHRWMGSIAQDQLGNIALGYSASSDTVYPSVRYTGRLASDPLGTMPQGEGSIIEGAGSQTETARWGDYSHLSVDPTDDCTFWYTNEYYGATSPRGWRTRIGSFKFPECSGALPPLDKAGPAITNVSDQPDPFTPAGRRKRNSKISFTVPEEVLVQVGIFKRSGKFVIQIADQVVEAGSYVARWNGKDRNGRIVKARSYIYVIEATDAYGNLTSATGTTTVRR